MTENISFPRNCAACGIKETYLGAVQVRDAEDALLKITLLFECRQCVPKKTNILTLYFADNELIESFIERFNLPFVKQAFDRLRDEEVGR